MNEETKSHFGPIIGQIRQLDPVQRRAGQKILFWILFFYLQVWILEGASKPLLAFIVAFGLVATAFPRTQLGQRGSFLTLNGAISVAILLSAVPHPSAVLFVDGALLGTLTALEITHRSRHW